MIYLDFARYHCNDINMDKCEKFYTIIYNDHKILKQIGIYH